MNMDGDLIELQGAIDKGFVDPTGSGSVSDTASASESGERSSLGRDHAHGGLHDPDAGSVTVVESEDRFQQVSEDVQWKDALSHTVHKGSSGAVANAGHQRPAEAFVEVASSSSDFSTPSSLGNTNTKQNDVETADEERHEWDVLVRHVGHCTAVVALTPDGEDLLVGHNSWEDYNEMLRCFKHYEFAHAGHNGASRTTGSSGSSASKTPPPPPHRVSMSSYPGLLASTDDYYQLGNGLVVVETTLVILDSSVLRKIQMAAVPSWIASLVANRIAVDAEAWTQIFQRHNAGTYNCQWMVVDYNKFCLLYTSDAADE